MKKPMSNLLLRIITGVIIAALTLSITYVGGLAFQIFSLGIGIAILYEWISITNYSQSSLVYLYSWLVYLALTISILANVSFVIIITGFVISVLIYYLLLKFFSVDNLALLQSLGLVYAALFPISFILLRSGLSFGDSIGLLFVFFTYIVVWASDIGAYFCGRMLGGPKLAKAISPNKTWSGALGGVSIAVVVSVIFTYLIWPYNFLQSHQDVQFIVYPVLLVIALTTILSIVSQIGDLAESFLKRKFDVKDSSNLLPGHGGVMDRIDGLLPAGVVFTGFLVLSTHLS